MSLVASGIGWSVKAKLWIAGVVAFCLAGAATALTPAGGETWGSAGLFVWTAVPAALLCALGGMVVVAVGLRHQVAEVTLLGGAATTAALTVMAHALTSPVVGTSPSTGYDLSGALMLPLAMVTAAPLAAPRASWARAAARSYRAWVGVCLGATASLGLVAWSLRTSHVSISPYVAALPVVLAAVVAFRIAFRQFALHQISRRPAALVASMAIAEMGCAGLLRIIVATYSPAWWLLAVLDVVASLLLIGAVIVGYRTRGGVRALLAPVVARDPLSAMELGFSSLVHAYVAELERKDQITRDHVVRVAELAIRSGERLRLAPDRLHWLGVGALLHDIGKLAIPDEILGKPGRLSDDETAVMRTHASVGGDLVVAEPALARAAWMVRGHHERFDGAGYPDGLAGDELPIEAALVSACDAYDAMAHTRQYRVGLGRDRAIAVLREHSGAQWNPVAVQAVIDVLPGLAVEPVFDQVGTGDVSFAASCYQDWFQETEESASVGTVRPR